MTGTLHFIVGGARSGKSTYAETLAARRQNVLYIATAKSDEPGMEQRIELHRARRPDHWQTVERYKGFGTHDWSERIRESKPEAVLLDCLTLLISNHLFDCGEIVDESKVDLVKIEAGICSEIDALIASVEDRGDLIIVSNEVGLGLSSPYPLGNLFRDLSGRVNRYVAERADQVTFMAVGLPLKLK